MPSSSPCTLDLTISQAASRFISAHQKQITITFSDKEELAKGVMDALHEFKRTYWLDFFNIKKRLVGDLSFDITNLNDPKDASPDLIFSFIQALRQILKQHSQIKKISCSDDSIIEPTLELLQQTITHREHEQLRRRSRSKSYILNGILTGALKGGLPRPFLLMAIQTLIEVIIFKIYNIVSQKFYDYAASFYDANTPIASDSERIALQNGAKAVSLWGYIASFFQYTNWRHPLAFSAGLEHGLEKNEDVLDNIFKRTPLYERKHAIKLKIQQNKTLLKRSTKAEQSKWIAFSTEEELKEQVHNLLTSFLAYNTMWNNKSTLSFEGDPTSCGPAGAFLPPPYFYSAMHRVLLQHSFITEFKKNENYPTLNLSRLSLIPQATKDEEKRRANKQQRYALIGASIGLAVCLLAGVQSILLMLLSMIILSAVAKIYESLNQSFLDYAAQFYETPADLQNMSNPAEKEVLRFGIEANTYLGYAKSFLPFRLYQATRHPVAFAGGLEQAQRKNEEVVNCGRTLNP